MSKETKDGCAPCTVILLFCRQKYTDLIMSGLEWLGNTARRFGLLSDKCYETVVNRGLYTDRHCATVAFSKAIGLAIITASAIVKVPQIAKIVYSRSAKGVSPLMYLLEVYALMITVAFAVRTSVPFTSYGESCFLLLQDFIILALLWKYSGRKRSYMSSGALIAVYVAFGYALAGPMVTRAQLQVLRQTCMVAFIASKVPQIVMNFQSGSTGQLSVITQGLQFIGNAARIATTFGDPGAFSWTVLCDLMMSFMLNGILTTQIVVYGAKKGGKKTPSTKKKGSGSKKSQ